MWVDSICIDQDSLIERNHQVRLMGEIYEKATTVLVWLGEPNEETMIAFDQLRILGESSHLPARESQILRSEKSGQWKRSS
jgi:hypothetical protein